MSMDIIDIDVKDKDKKIELEAKPINIDVDIADLIQTLEISEEGIEQIIVEAQDIEAIETDTLGRGLPGVGLNYKWDGTKLGVKRENQAEYQFIDLQGVPGMIGKGLEFIWEGTKLGIRVQGDSQYTFVDLQGECKELTNLEIEELLK